MNDSYKGSCLCGDVKYEVTAFGSEIANCHCRMCRKFTGAAYATYAAVEQRHFRWLQGADLLQDYVAENNTTRRFCGRCGSGLTFASAGNANTVIEVAVATLDDNLPVEPDAHIYVGYKANWVSVTDGKPEYLESRDSQHLNPKHSADN